MFDTPAKVLNFLEVSGKLDGFSQAVLESKILKADLMSDHLILVTYCEMTAVAPLKQKNSLLSFRSMFRTLSQRLAFNLATLLDCAF